MSSGQTSTTIRIALAAVVVLAVLGIFLFLTPPPPPAAKDPAQERQRLIAGLRAGKPETRATCAARLGNHRPVARETVAALAFALSDPDLVVQTNAAKALAEIGPLLSDRPEWAELAVPPAINGLDDTALVALPLSEFLSHTGVAGQPAIPALRRFITFKGPKQRAAAINALIKLDPEHAEVVLPGLAGLLNEPSPEMRGEGLALLSRLGDKARPSVPKLIVLIDGDPEPGIRVDAAYTLVKVSPPDGPRAVAGLVAVIKDIDERTGGKLKAPNPNRPDPAVINHPLNPTRTAALALLLKLDPKAAESANQ